MLLTSDYARTDRAAVAIFRRLPRCWRV